MIYNFKRWMKNSKLIIADIVTGVGLFWLLVEIGAYSTNGKIDSFTKGVLVFLIAFLVILIISLIRNKPVTSFVYKLRNKDSFIEIRVGDAFHNNGALVIPINDHFDVSLGGNVKKANSLQNKLIKEFYSDKEEHLLIDISNKLNTNQSYEIGKTIEIEQKGKLFYLLVNSRRKENNRVESSVDDFLLSLSKLWSYIALESGRNSVVTIPIIGTNHGRITNITRVVAIKEIIDSYIDSSKHLNIADRLIISIHPDDLKKGNIDLDELDEYLKFSCKHYKEIKFSDKTEGNPVSESKVESITR